MHASDSLVRVGLDQIWLEVARRRDINLVAVPKRADPDLRVFAVLVRHVTAGPGIGIATAWPDGSYGPIVDQTAIAKAVKGLAKKVNTKPLSATFMVSKSGGIVGVKAGHAGRTLDVDATSQAIQDALVARAGAGTDPKTPVTPVLAIAQPALTTEQAQKSAPLMRRISSWTTYYEPGAHNGFGANITIPSMAINGTVVAPGGWFSYWKTVGEVSLAKGYKLGGAIIDGHSVEGKSIGGGICSSSTTIFNAALRAGLQMGARKNHYYYISRYPKGLDATVFISDGGGAQDMTFRNDTKYPILSGRTPSPASSGSRSIRSRPGAT